MITIHKALPHDIAVVVGYIEKKAAFDRAMGCFDGKLGTTPERIAKALFGSPAFAHALLSASDEKPVGFAFYHYRFSSFQARPSLWLDDLFVDANFRRVGAGVALMSALATEAIKYDCTHLAWTADDRNPSGIPFYTKIGATLISQVGSRSSYSIAPETLAMRRAEIARQNPASDERNPTRDAG